MAEIIASSLVELAHYGVIAYAIKQGRDVVIRWLETTTQRPSAEQQILDLARQAGVDLQALAQKGAAS